MIISRKWRSGSWIGWVWLMWLLLSGAGWFRLADYQNSPDSDGQLPQTVSARNESPSDRRSTMLVFLHPHCPCSRATVRQLEAIVRRNCEPLTIRVMFLHPSGTPEDWHRTELWDRTQAIPGVEVADDTDGALTRRYGVRYSGHALLYNKDGERIYSGGITVSRGHEGDHPIRAFLTGQKNPEMISQCCPVFGCPLFPAGEPAQVVESDP
jgi:hypothetical protein